MKQLASTSVKCEINDKNLEIFKKALTWELWIDASEWKGNELDFCSLDKYCNVHIAIEDLPDSKGYSIRAWGQLTKEGHSKANKNLVMFFIFASISVVGWWWLIKMIINIKQFSIFIGWNLPSTVFVFFLLLFSFGSWDYWHGGSILENKAKRMKEAFDQAFSVYR